MEWYVIYSVYSKDGWNWYGWELSYRIVEENICFKGF